MSDDFLNTAAIMWRLALGLQQRSKFLRVCFLPTAPAPAPASKPSAYQLPLSLLGRGSYRGSCTLCCLPCSKLTASTGCLLHVGHRLCSASNQTRPTINSCPITFDFHFRHSLLEHKQPSAYFILLPRTYRGSVHSASPAARAKGCPGKALKRGKEECV